MGRVEFQPLALPDSACNSWRMLYAGLAKLTEDLTERIHIENNVFSTVRILTGRRW